MASFRYTFSSQDVEEREEAEGLLWTAIHWGLSQCVRLYFLDITSVYVLMSCQIYLRHDFLCIEEDTETDREKVLEKVKKLRFIESILYLSLSSLSVYQQTSIDERGQRERVLMTLMLSLSVDVLHSVICVLIEKLLPALDEQEKDRQLVVLKRLREQGVLSSIRSLLLNNQVCCGCLHCFDVDENICRTINICQEIESVLH
jgi:hypothetical protein